MKLLQHPIRLALLCWLPMVAFSQEKETKAASAINAIPLAPQRNWRLKPIGATIASGGGAPLSSKQLLQGVTCELTGVSPVILAIRFKPTFFQPVLLTYSSAPQVRIRLERASLIRGGDMTADWPSDSRQLHWTQIAEQESGPALNKVDLPPTAGSWLRLIITPDSGNTLRLGNVGLYGPQMGARNDYWIAIGASLQAQSMRQSRFAPWVKKTFPGSDPIIFNLGVRGWGSSDIRRNLPALLEQHPFATYVLLDIGGNNVTAFRPFPGGAEALSNDITSILDTLRSLGKIPVLARLSYRKYREPFAVGPEENGSAPYNTRLIDSLCFRYTPEFFESREHHCAVDFYEHFKLHPEELSADGVHLRPNGEMSWVKIWAEKAGERIYGRPAVLAVAPQAKLLRMTRGELFRVPLPWPAKPGRYSVVFKDSRDRIVRAIQIRILPGAQPPMAWDLHNRQGKPVTQGLYSYKVEGPHFREEGRLMLLP